MSKSTKLIRTTVVTAVFAVMAFIPPTGGTQEACAATEDPCDAIRDAALEACLGALETYFEVITGEATEEEFQSDNEMCQDQFNVWKKHCKKD